VLHFFLFSFLFFFLVFLLLSFVVVPGRHSEAQTVDAEPVPAPYPPHHAQLEVLLLPGGCLPTDVHPVGAEHLAETLGGAVTAAAAWLLWDGDAAWRGDGPGCGRL
jgi:hypothetical protein